MKNTMKYKGYTGSIEWSEPDGVFYGRVLGIKSLLLYEGNTVDELKKEFHIFIDEYLEDCKENNIKPEIPFEGSLNVRVSPKIHKLAVNVAYDRDVSLNSIVNEALKAYLL